MTWWHDDQAVRRFVCDIVATELAALRPTAPRRLFPDLDVDSIELVAVATALNETLHLHESGVEDLLLARRTIDDWIIIAQRGLEARATHMTFRTSGSTDVPKRCTHALSALCEEVDELAPMFDGHRRVLTAVPSHHIYGFLFTILLPRGRPVVEVRDRLPSPARWCAGDLVVGHPEFWNSIVRAGVAIPAGVTGVTSTAPCPNDVAKGLAALGLDSLVQVYGSSETAGIGVRCAMEQPYTLLSYWHRDAAASETLVRIAPDGVQTPYTLQDALEWSGPREFRPTGRRDDAIQVAGVNVFPSRVRRVLMEHPDVADVAVRRIHADEMSRLKAFVVPRDDGPGDIALHVALEKWVATRLSAPERPKAFSFGATLPRDALGKLADWALPEA